MLLTTLKIFMIILLNQTKVLEGIMKQYWIKNMRSHITYFKLFILHKQRRKMEKSCRCNYCSIDVHRASFAKPLRTKKHLEKLRQKGRIKPE